MNSVVEFMDTFNRLVSENDLLSLQSTLKNGSKHIQNIPTSDSGLALAIMFDHQKGILRYMEKMLKAGKQKFENELVMKEAYLLIVYLIEHFQMCYEPYILKTKEICHMGVKFRYSYTMKKAASLAYNKLIEIFNDDMDLDNVVHEFVKDYKIYTPKERSILYTILGTIANFCPERHAISTSKDKIFKLILNDLDILSRNKELHKNITSQPYEVKMYLDSLSGLLNNFTPFENCTESSEEYFQHLYKYIRLFGEHIEDRQRKPILYKNVELLSNRMMHFGKLIVKDYEYWHKIFLNLATSKNTANNTIIIFKATKSFYETIARELDGKDSMEDKRIFSYFKKYFAESLLHADMSSNLLRLDVYGFSCLASIKTKYLLETEVEEMLSLMVRQTVPFYLRENEVDGSCSYISDYIEAISKILHHKTQVSVDQVLILVKLSGLLMKRFPNLRAPNQRNAVVSLKNAIKNVSYLSENLRQIYFHNLVYQGVLWTCSHTLYVDAELEKELQELNERPLCYKNYIPLWNGLLKAENAEKKTLHQFFNELMLTLLTVIKKLNLNTKTMDNVVFFDASISMIAENEEDFRVFVNLVDFYVEVIENVESFLLTEWVEKLLFGLVKYSYEHPLISGFYKLVNVILRISQIFMENEIEAPSEQLSELISQYFTSIINQVCDFSNELQRVCIYTILDTPLCFVPEMLDSTVPVFKIAFNIGLTELDLAFKAFEALELWTRELGNKATHFLLEVVGCLEPYLQSESSAEINNDISITIRRRRTILIDDERSLEALQRRIMIFLGTLDSKILHRMVHEKCSRNTEGSWNKKDLVDYEIPIFDIRIKFFLDNLLPRLVDLASSSGDEQTKITACEVLHSVITVILGKKISDRCLDKNICSTLLKLGCDANQIVRQLYHPLILQMTHWFSSKRMLESPVTQYFVDSFFEGLTADSALRDYSGICLREFIEWSLRQSSDNDLMNSPINIKTTIRRITNLALHPSKKKRIAAAIAFNHLYTILRENEDIINMYWLEFLYVFIKSLEGCNDIRIIDALGHVEKVIIYKSTLFNTPKRSRRKPLEFDDETLKSAVMWLFKKCASLDEKCRKTSMKLVENLSPRVFQWNSANDLISSVVNTDGVQKIHNIILENLEENPEKISKEYLSTLLRALHFYTWLFDKELISIESMFKTNSMSNFIFNCLNNFVKLISIDETEMECDDEEVIITQDSEELNCLKCSAVLRLFQFMESLFKPNLADNVYIPENLWNTDLFKLISNCTLSPQTVGFTAKNLQITVELPQQMENLIKIMTRNLPDVLLKQLFTELSEVVASEPNVLNIQLIMNDDTSTKSKEIVSGLKLLRKCQVLDKIEMGIPIVQNSSEKITEIFSHLHFDTFSNSGVSLVPSVKEYLENVLELLLEEYQPETIHTLINCIVTDEIVSVTDTSTTTKGTYFYNEFKDVICKGMLKNTTESMKVLDNVLWKYPDDILNLIEELCLYAQRVKSDYTEILANEVIERCISLRNTINNLEYRKKKFTHINQVVVRMKNNPVEVSTKRTHLYFWILEEYNLSKDLNAKADILQGFLVCLTGETSESNSELGIILQLRNNDSSSWSQELAFSEMKRLEATHCLQVLLMMLPITKSVVVWQSAIRFAAGGCCHIFDSNMNEYISSFFISASDETLTKALDVAYQLFMDLNTIEERFDVLRKFLLPAINFCKASCVNEFYVKHLDVLYSYLSQDIVKLGSRIDRKKCIVTQIAVYNLFEVMLAKMEYEDIENLKFNNETPIKPEIFKRTFSIRSFRTSIEEEKEIVRVLHCAAYNCSIALISLKREERFYKYLFPEYVPNKKSIWENIVDCNKRYGLRQDVKESTNNQKKLINIRKNIADQMNCGRTVASFTHHYNLASSTLTEDIHAYDLNAMTIAKRNQSNNVEDQRMNLEFEEGDFNEHECMTMISATIIHMFQENVFYLHKVEDFAEPPQWMKSFSGSLMINVDNVRLFLLKIISNTKNCFLPYIHSFLVPLITCINGYLQNNALNHIITDILIIIIEAKVFPQNEDEIKVSNELIEHLIKRAPDDSKDVYRYNVQIVETLIKSWNAQLKVPENLYVRIAPGTTFDTDLAANLILIFLKNNMEHDLIKNDNVFNFLFNSIDNWKAEESTAFQKFEAIGWYFNFIATKLQFEDRRKIIKNKLTKIFTDMQMHNPDRLVGCICAASKGSSEIAIEFLVFIQNNISKVSDTNKPNCLEVLLICIPKIERHELTKELGYSTLKNLIRNKVLSCERIGLKIVTKLVDVLEPKDLLPWIICVSPFSKNDNSIYRKMAYEIFMAVYRKYNVATDDSDVKALINVCRNSLVSGLLDMSKEIYDEVLKFWTDDIRLPERSTDKLLSILKIYDQDVQENFLPFLCLFLLNQTSKSLDYNEIMFTPLVEETFKEYQIALNWRRNNLASMAPMFVPSLASQVNRVFTQTGASLQTSTFAMPTNYMELRATQDFEFEPTIQQEQYAFNRLDTDIQQIPDPAQNKLSRRLISNADNTPGTFRKPLPKRQMKIYRKYQAGDFPHVEICHATVITPLMELIKKDWLICKSIAISLIYALIERMKTVGEFSEQLINIFASILQNHSGRNTIVPTILEIILKTKRVGDFDDNGVTKICKTMGLYSLGILLLEEKLIENNHILEKQPGLEPPQKKIRINTGDNNEWVHLASLYKCIDEDDVTLSIFKKPIFSKHLQEASFAQAASDWVAGKRWYEHAYNEEDGAIKEHCFTGLLECMNQLSSWKEIDECIARKLDNDYDLIWNNAQKDELIPWLFRAQTQKMIENATSKSVDGDSTLLFKRVLEKWLSERELVLNREFGEELAMFFLSDQAQVARKYLKCGLNAVKEQWIHSSCMSEKLREHKLLKLRGLSNIEQFLKATESSDLTEGVNNLMQYWERHAPSPRDDLALWNVHVSYRLFFSQFIQYRIAAQIDEDSEAAASQLVMADIRQRMKIIDIGIKRYNKSVTKKHVLKIEKILYNDTLNLIEQNPGEQEELYDRFDSICIKYWFLSGELEKDKQKKLTQYVKSWEKSRQVLDKEVVDANTKVEVIRQLCDTAITLKNFVSSDIEFRNLVAQNEFIINEIKADPLQDIGEALHNYSYSVLKNCCETKDLEHSGDCFFNLAKYCYSFINNSVNQLKHIQEEFIRSTLKAMSCGSQESTRYFPCLLKSEYYENNENAKVIFIQESETVPSWLFLSWQTQILSHLATTIAELVIPIIRRLVVDYPNGVMYNFRLVIETKPELCENPVIKEISDILFKRPGVEKFIAALEFVVQPEIYLTHYLEKLENDIVDGKSTTFKLAVNSLISKLFTGENSLRGPIYASITKYKSILENIANTSAKEKLKIIIRELKTRKVAVPRFRRPRAGAQLKEYSPYLHVFSGEEIEVPGQYGGDRKPMMRYHATIVRFEQYVQVMESKTKPIKITMIGNDAKNYSFLAKFGEDLRLDQRIQQIFSITNKTLESNIACSQRHLSIDTYQIIPLSTCFGLIQWIDNTRSMKDFVEFSLKDKNVLVEMERSYERWIIPGLTNKSRAIAYKEALVKHSPSQVIAKMKEIINKIEWNCLKNTFLLISSSLESFMSLRHNFITSYATMCITHWIVGVGDRHLQNTLIAVKSGRCLGIDFGLAFGTGVDICIPELMPFRLTPQILGVLKPFTEHDLMGATMVHALRALRDAKGPLMACLDVFVNEDLNWTENINKFAEITADKRLDTTTFPKKKKIIIVEKKLNGVKPSLITIQELTNAHDDKYLPRYTTIVNGTDGTHSTLRATITNEQLSPEDQVTCLLDQATDLNILGRTWQGWAPYV